MTDPSRYAARYYDGKSARAQAVVAEISKDGIAIYRDPGVFLAAWRPASLVLAEKPGQRDPVRIGLTGTTARLVIEDRDALAALLAVAPHAPSGYRASPKALIRGVAWTGAAAGAVAAIVFVLIPLLSAQLAARTPAPMKERIGAAVLRQVTELAAYLPDETRKPRYCTGSAGLTVLRSLTSRITAGMRDPPALRPVVIDAKLVNAFALPGGYVVLTDGLLRAVESPEEIAGVLAHEIGHVVHDHPTRAIFRSTAVSLLVSAVIGDITGGLLITSLAEWTLNSSYSRDAEREADAFAVVRLNATGIDGRGLERFFARMLDEMGRPEGGAIRFFSTHPPTAERIDYIRRRARADGRALTDPAWDALRTVCVRTQPDPPAFRNGGAR